MTNTKKATTKSVDPKPKRPSKSVEAMHQSLSYDYQLIEIDKVKPYPLNSKIHSEESIRELQMSISTTGLSHPISVDKNMVIIGGHGRLEACKRLGMKFIKVWVRDDLSENEVKVARIAENKVVSNDYDSSLMRLELQEINLDEIDSIIPGISFAELEKITMQYDTIDPTVFTKNLSSDVSEQAKDGLGDIKKSDLKQVSVTNGLGFKMVTVGETRAISRWMAKIQEEYGKENPVEAFMDFIKQYTGA